MKDGTTHSPRCNNRLAAFTLIELLVVFAIIALLAGLRLPALAANRQKGRQTAWLSNLKTPSQAGADLQPMDDPTIGIINGAAGVELAVDSYFPDTIASVLPELAGRTIHPGGRCRVFLDGHIQFIKDGRTPDE